MISDLFKTRYRIDLHDKGYLSVNCKKWYHFEWRWVDSVSNMEDAMKAIADHKNPPEPVKPITVYEE